MGSRKNVSHPIKKNPYAYGSSPQQSAQGANEARAAKQQKMNTGYRGSGGRVPANYGISPDSPSQGYSPFPTFRTSGVSSQNSNSASKDGNNNLAVGNENQKYDICATNPSASVCAGTGITTSLPKPKKKVAEKRKSLVHVKKNAKKFQRKEK